MFPDAKNLSPEAIRAAARTQGETLLSWNRAAVGWQLDAVNQGLQQLEKLQKTLLSQGEANLRSGVEAQKAALEAVLEAQAKALDVFAPKATASEA